METDKILQQILQEATHQKMMGINVDYAAEIKKDKLLNSVFNLYGFQVKLSLEEKLNLIERELVKMYK